MYRLSALLLILTCTTSAQAERPALPAWVGEYEYSEAEPPDLIMDYVFRVYADGRATVNIDGHLTMIHLLATATAEREGVLGIFYDRTLDPESPKLGLKRGDRIVTLQKNGRKYSMRWAGLTSQLGQPQAQVEIDKRK